MYYLKLIKDSNEKETVLSEKSKDNEFGVKGSVDKTVKENLSSNNISILKKLNIAIDIDNCLVENFKQAYDKACKDNEEFNINKLYYSDRYDEKFIRHEDFLLYPKKNAKEILGKLYCEGCRIYIITEHNGNKNGGVIYHMLKWLTKYKFYPTHLVSNVIDKGSYCFEQNIDILIDAKEYFNTQKHSNVKNMVVSDWNDVYNKIKVIKGEINGKIY